MKKKSESISLVSNSMQFKYLTATTLNNFYNQNEAFILYLLYANLYNLSSLRGYILMNSTATEDQTANIKERVGSRKDGN